jgi:signal transduction histidine kinase
MSLLATVLWTWSAVYAFASAYYVALWGRTRRRDPEHIVYAFACVGLAIHTAGSALIADAGSLRDGVFALRIQYIGSFASIAFFVDFTSHLIGRPRRETVLATYGTCALGVGLAVLGGLFDDARSVADIAPGSGSPYAAIEPALRPIGATVLAIAIALALSAVAAVAPRARQDPDARLLLLGTSLSALAGIHDALVRAGVIRSVYLFEHAALVALLAVGHVVVRRFALTAIALESREGELARSYEELRMTQEELVRKEQLAAVGELSAVIAHEVRNPLAILKNAVSSLRRSTLTPTDRAVLLGILDEETNRLNRLVRDLLAYARPLVPKGTSIELEPLVRRAIDIACGARPRAVEPEIEIDLRAAPLAVHGDADLLRQAFVNVIDNALQAMPAGGRLRVEGRTETIEGSPAVAISFTDTGEGMDVVVRAKALDPFFTTRPAGTGLGLAIVDRVVKNHGGMLDIESARAVGTTVTLTLPVPT